MGNNGTSAANAQDFRRSFGTDFVSRRAEQLGSAGPDELRAVASVVEGMDGAFVTGPLTAERLRGLAAELEAREIESGMAAQSVPSLFWRRKYEAERRYSRRLLDIIVKLIDEVDDDADSAPIGEPLPCGTRFAFVFVSGQSAEAQDPLAMGVEAAMDLVVALAEQEDRPHA